MKIKDLEQDYEFIESVVIPSGNIQVLEYYLLANESRILEYIDIINPINNFFGVALAYDNNQIISLLNLFVREHKIRIDKTKLLEKYYYEKFNIKCREARSQGYMIGDCADFSDMQTDLVWATRHLFR